MLDYDSMRSKVKRLTEKPDKDPSKLPRTEKEMEMVRIFAPTLHRCRSLCDWNKAYDFISYRPKQHTSS